MVSLTRESRILILLGVFGLGAVVVLMAMADKYRTMLDPSADGPRSERGAEASVCVSDGVMQPFRGERGSAAEADDRVRRYLAVRRTLAEASRTLIGPGGSVGSATRTQIQGHRDLALARVGLELGDYVGLRDRHRAWRSGEDAASDRMTRAFEKAREQLDAVEKSIHPSLDL